MSKLIKILPLILVFAMSCSPLKPPADNVELDENFPRDVIIDPENVNDKVDEAATLDLDKPFVPLEYEIEDAFPFLQFEQPLLLTNANNETNIVYVVEKTGRIKYFWNDSSVATSEVFLDLSTRVDTSGNEKGLLGLAFHPDYKDNGYFYVNYTDKDSTIIARYSKKTDSNEGDFNSEEILLKFKQTFANHNGGHLEFGPDGYLYIATGDGGGGGDPQNNSQNRKNLLGKILRIDVNNAMGDKLYSIPVDNPYKGNTEGYMEEIYAYGLRNPWRFSYDRERDLLILADVGQDKIEEINIINSGGNYGWNIMEGTLNYTPVDNIPDNLVPPIWEYDRSGGRSITGGYTYYGELNPSLYGTYIYGDFITGKVWGMWLDKEKNVHNHELLDTDLMISSFGLDEEGELYLVDFKGKIYKIKTRSE